MTLQRITIAPARAAEPKTIFILHPSDYLTDNAPNGDGLIAFQFIQHLAARGHRLHIAVRHAALQQELPPNVVLYEIPCFVKWPLLARLEYMIRIRLLFEKLRTSEHIELLHQMNPVFTGLSLAFIDVNLPLVLGTIVPRWPEEYSDCDYGPIRKVLSAARKAIAGAQQRFASVLLLTSPAALNRIPFPRRVQHKIRHLQHGINLDLFIPAHSIDASERQIHEPSTILFFAGLLRRKGIFTLLDAFERVAVRMPECRLLIAGDGPEAESIKRRVKTMPYGSRVELLGSITRNEAPALLRSCTVYCLPSFGEPFGTTILEAMSCGKPIVSTCSGGTPHFVPAEGSRLVSEGDSLALADALLQVLQDPNLQASMGLANRRCIEQNHNWNSIIQNLEQIYSEVIDHPDKPAGRQRWELSSAFDR